MVSQSSATYPGAAVADELAAFLLRDGDLGPGDDGTGERGAEEVDVFVRGVALHGGEAELFDEFVNDVLLKRNQ
jgi:hypothetical protein